MKQKPIRIGVLICLSESKHYDALKFLILYQNSLQKSIEYHILPYPEEPNPFDILFNKEKIDRDKSLNDIINYQNEYLNWLNQRAESYGLNQETVDGIIILSMSRFLDNYYLTGIGNLELLALGNWERFMAPPSLVEFILTQLVGITVDIACGNNFPARHHTTIGCAFDFCSHLDEAKFKSLCGNVCSICQEIIFKNCSEDFFNDIQLLLKKDWLGSSKEPSYASITAKKLGYDLFHTKGIAPNLWEKFKQTLQDEIAKNIIKIISTILLAALLLWLGLKST